MLKISVIIPSFNQGKYLEETILSILNQEYPLLEIFLIDGGSTDNTLDIINKYSDRLTAWISEPDKGQSDAINRGLKMCTGEIVTWLCSDDLYTPGALMKVNEAFSTLPDSVGVIYGNSEIFSDAGVIRYHTGYDDRSIEKQLSGMAFAQPSSFVKRAKFLEIGPLNIDFHYGMDYDMFARLTMICEFAYVDFCFSKYRLHSKSKSTTAISKFIDEWNIIFNSIVDGLDIKEIKKALVDTGLKVQSDPYILKYFQSVTERKPFETDKLLFSFLVNVIKYDYASGKFANAARIGKYLRKNLNHYLEFEPSIQKIIRRSILIPHPILKVGRKIIRTITHKPRPIQTGEKLKIAFVTSHINRSTQWIWFSEELLKRNIPHIHIIINEFKPLLYDDLKQEGAEVYYLPHKNKLSFLVNLFRTIKILKKNKIDVVHTELPHGNLVGLTAAYLCGIKMRITTCENTTWFSDFDSRKQKSIDRLTYMLSKKVVALTTESYAYLKKHFKLPNGKLLIIRHSLKSSDFLNLTNKQVKDLRDELEIPEGIFVIGMVARFEYWKGHIYAIEAMKKLVQEFPNVRLYIFGSKGESFDSVINLIKKEGLEKYIIYKGFVHNNIALFKIFDIHLHIPIKLESETFGINIMEGMVSGCAQVLTYSGISSFSARPDRNCIIVPYQSSEAVYLALKKLITDKEFRLKIGNQAREDAVKLFRYTDKVDEHLKLYERLKMELTS